MAEGISEWFVSADQKPECDLCKIEIPYRSAKCLDCHLFICDRCSRNHKTLSTTKHHRIIQDVERNIHQNLAISTRICKSHPDIEIENYCSTCKTFICVVCVKGHHKKHNWSSIHDAAYKERENLKNFLQVCEERISDMNTKLENIDFEQNRSETIKHENARRMEARKIELIADIEEAYERYLDHFDSKQKENVNKLKSASQRVKPNFEELKTLYKENRDICEKGSDIEIIMAKEFIEENRHLLKPPEHAGTQIRHQYFIEGRKTNKVGMINASEFGVEVTLLSEIDAKLLIKFPGGRREDVIENICPLNDNYRVLISKRDSYDNIIVSAADKDKLSTWPMTLDFYVSDAVMISLNTIIAISAEYPGKIYKLGKDKTRVKKVQFIDSPCAQPIGICKSKDGNILVSFIDFIDANRFTPDGKSSRFVSRITTKAETINVYEFDDEGKRLFVAPTSVAENTNMDMCVINKTSDNRGHLVILDYTGRLKVKYRGRRQDAEFYPAVVKCNHVGHVILSERHYKTVHILDSEGTFLQYLLTEKSFPETPFSLAIDNSGAVWVGCLNSQIYLVKYLEETKIDLKGK